MNLTKSFTVNSGNTGHIQGIAIDKERKYAYQSFTTTLIKTDLNGNIIGSVTGLAGHLGCIAYNYDDGKVYGSLEFKHDKIGKGILDRIGRVDNIKDGFYIVCFDVDKITKVGMDAEKDGVMTAVFLQEVLNDYTAPNHKYGCSGIDGITLAPEFGSDSDKKYIYVAYGICGDDKRVDNDYQVLLKYDVDVLNAYAKPLNQLNMHASGPEAPNDKIFVYTGNTTFGIQNLEYDPFSKTIICAVYVGHKEQFPNYTTYFIDVTKPVKQLDLVGINEKGSVASLKNLGVLHKESGIYGCNFPYGSTGIATLNNGYFYVSEPFNTESGFSSVIRLYEFNKETATFKKA